MRLVPLFALSLTSAAIPLAAQQPELHASVALQPGQALSTVLVGRPGQLFASLLDAHGGPVALPGATLYLGLTGQLLLLDAGALPPAGLRVRSIPTPNNLPVGTPLYLQSLVLDNLAPNGLFRASDGESTVFYRSAAVMVEKFRDPLAEGLTGTFDASVRGRLQGAPVMRRTQAIEPPEGVLFGLPIQTPLNLWGTRAQMVYRAVDLGASGEEEVVSGIHWRPFRGQPVIDDTFQRLVIDVAHSHVVPDYSIDPMSALPRFPSSGLSETFAANIKPGEQPLRIYDGAYSIRAADLRADGYLPYPAPTQRFTYNGRDSLLLDFRMVPSPSSHGQNGQEVYLMVQSAAQPNSRVVDAGTATATVDPFQSTMGSTADNVVHALQVELARVKSTALSPWRAAPVSVPDYHTPSVAASVPAGAEVIVEYRGSSSASGASATAWWTNIDVADRLPYLQYRVTLIADVVTGQVPSVDAIVIPIN